MAHEDSCLLRTGTEMWYIIPSWVRLGIIAADRVDQRYPNWPWRGIQGSLTIVLAASKVCSGICGISYVYLGMSTPRVVGYTG